MILIYRGDGNGLPLRNGSLLSEASSLVFPSQHMALGHFKKSFRCFSHAFSVTGIARQCFFFACHSFVLKLACLASRTTLNTIFCCVYLKCTSCSESLFKRGNEPSVLFSLIEFNRTVALGLSGLHLKEFHSRRRRKLF